MPLKTGTDKSFLVKQEVNMKIKTEHPQCNMRPAFELPRAKWPPYYDGGLESSQKAKGKSSSTAKLTCRKLTPPPPALPAYFRKMLTSVCFNRLNSGSKPTQRRSKVKTHILPFLFPRCF